MYVENKETGEARVGWVESSRTHRTLRYAGRALRRVGSGYKWNAFDEDTGETYWVSGPHRDGRDRLYGGVVAVDEDARVAYWTEVRARPGVVDATYRAGAATRTGPTTRQLVRRR